MHLRAFSTALLSLWVLAAGCGFLTDLGRSTLSSASGCTVGRGVSECRRVQLQCQGRYAEYETDKGQIECSCCDEPDRPR